MPAEFERSNIGRFYDANSGKDPFVYSITQARQEQFERHGLKLSLFETLAMRWKEIGKLGLVTKRNTDRSETIVQDSAQDRAGRELVQKMRPDSAAVFLGNVALALYAAEETGEFSLYDFAARYNFDMHGTNKPVIPSVKLDHPAYVLSDEERAALHKSFVEDPTGTDAMGKSRLWPDELKLLMVQTPELTAEGFDMLEQLPLFKERANQLLTEDPDAGKRLDPHPEKLLTVNVRADISAALGDS